MHYQDSCPLIKWFILSISICIESLCRKYNLEKNCCNGFFYKGNKSIVVNNYLRVHLAHKRDCQFIKSISSINYNL